MDLDAILHCNHSPKYEMVFDVAGRQKIYRLCSKCAFLDVFGKFLVSKQQVKEDSQNTVEVSANE